MLTQTFCLWLRLPSLLVFASLIASASPGFAMPVVCESHSCLTRPTGDKAKGHPSQLERIGSEEQQDSIRNAALSATRDDLSNEQVGHGGKTEWHQPPAACCMWLVREDIRPETWSYENWSTPGQPSDDDKFHHRFLTTWLHHYKNGGGWNGGWNHSGHDFDYRKWFFHMLFKKCNPPVPEPGTAALVALGLGLLALRYRRSR